MSRVRIRRRTAAPRRAPRGRAHRTEIAVRHSGTDRGGSAELLPSAPVGGDRARIQAEMGGRAVQGSLWTLAAAAVERAPGYTSYIRHVELDQVAADRPCQSDGRVASMIRPSIRDRMRGRWRPVLI